MEKVNENLKYWYSQGQVRELLGNRSNNYFYRFIGKNQIKTRRLGSLVLYLRQDVNHWLENRPEMYRWYYIDPLHTYSQQKRFDKLVELRKRILAMGCYDVDLREWIPQGELEQQFEFNRWANLTSAAKPVILPPIRRQKVYGQYLYNVSDAARMFRRKHVGTK